MLLRDVSETAEPRGRGWRHLLREVARQPDTDHLTGYVGLRLHDVEAHISTIAVHPDWRRRGLGELLLLTAMEHALELRAHLVTLEVRASNLVAQYLYHKYGFQFTGTHRGYYRDGEDAWLMAVEVSNNGYQTKLGELRTTLEDRLWRQTPPACQEEVGQNDRLAL